MRRRSYSHLSFLLILSGGGLVTAQERNAAQQLEDERNVAISGFELSISTDKKDYQVGELVTITAKLRNVSQTDARVQGPGDILFYKMDVRLTPLDPAEPGSQSKETMAQVTAYGRDRFNPLNSIGWGGFSIRAQHERVYNFELSKLYDMSLPGRYRITFSCKLPPKDGGINRVTLRSNETIVTVVME